MSGDLAKSQIQSFDQPARRRRAGGKTVDEVTFDGIGPVLRERFAPGWTWRETTGRSAGSDRCEKAHVGYCLEGCMAVIDRAGERSLVRAGDVFYIAPGHDAETVGDVDCVWVEFGLLG
ncbi:MAG: cupin [Actinobacteria bacterium]|nr:cupin [Actinomycetota bacterium]